MPTPCLSVSKPDAIGRYGLLILSISTSVTWFKPVIYKFISNDGAKADINLVKNNLVPQHEGGVAKRNMVTMDKKEPITVCGRENFQIVAKCLRGELEDKSKSAFELASKALDIHAFSFRRLFCTLLNPEHRTALVFKDTCVIQGLNGAMKLFVIIARHTNMKLQ